MTRGKEKRELLKPIKIFLVKQTVSDSQRNNNKTCAGPNHKAFLSPCLLHHLRDTFCYFIRVLILGLSERMKILEGGQFYICNKTCKVQNDE